MATKKISDLSLISAFDDTVNLAAEDASQTWRTTGAQIKSYIDAQLTLKLQSSNELIYHGLAASVSGNALTIALKQKNGSSDPTATNPVLVGFRNVTPATGDQNRISATAATSLVISSGSTLGMSSAIAGWIYVYAINNGGTIELGASTTLFDEGTVQSSTAEGGAGAADSAGVIYSATARTNKAIRCLGRILITEATAGTWATAPTEISLPPFELSYRSYFRVYTGNGFGSTNTKIRRFATVGQNAGQDFTYGDTAGAGGFVTINKAGVYSFSYGEEGNTGSPAAGLTLNSAGLTTDISSLTAAEVLVMMSPVSGNGRMACSYAGYFSAADVVRCHTNTGTAGFVSNAFGARFSGVRIG